MKNVKAIKIGADPEFCFKQNGELIDASSVLGYSFIDNSELGTDASDDTAEIRPEAGSYWQVADRISRLLKVAASFGYDGFAGSGDAIPLGGHIHFSGIQVSIDLQKKLNRFIASPLNSISDTKLRRREGFGHMWRLGNKELDIVRINHHGWEYRAAASWLSTPILTKGALAIAWVLAKATYRNDLHKIGNVDGLLKYSTKAESIHIRLFYDAIKNYKNNNIKLEQIEMFAAWGKSKEVKKPLLWVKYSEKVGLLMLKIKKVRCRCPIYFYDYLPYFTNDNKVVSLDQINLDRKMVLSTTKRLNKLGVSVSHRHSINMWQIGLSPKLLKNTDLTTTVIKTIAKEFNKYFKEKCVV